MLPFPPPIKGGIKSNYSMPPMDCARLAAVTPVMTLTKTRKVALMSWPYNRQSLVRCCVCSNCFKDTVHCLTENYFSNYLLSLAPRTGLNTDILRAQFSRVPPLIWKWNVHVCEAHTSLDISSAFYWSENIHQWHLGDILKVCLDTLFPVSLILGEL